CYRGVIDITGVHSVGAPALYFRRCCGGRATQGSHGSGLELNRRCRGRNALHNASVSARPLVLGGVGMKTVRIKRSGLLLAVIMGVALAGLITRTGSALAQAQGGSQTGETPLWKSALYGSSTPLLDVSEQPGYLQGLSVSGFVNSLTGMWV